MWREKHEALADPRVGAAAAVRWAADAGSTALVHAGINVVFRFTTGGDGRYLRLMHADLRTRAEVYAGLDYLRHVANRGAPVCAPVPSVEGALLEDLKLAESTVFAHAVRAVPGRPIDAETPDPKRYGAWGRALARLHAAAEDYTPLAEAPQKTWDAVWNDLKPLIPADDAGGRAEYARVEAWLRALPQPAEAFGLTHGDHRAGNALWDGHRVHIIDFDEPVYHWFAADVARPFIDVADRPAEERRRLLDTFVAGYRAVRPLADRWVRDVGWFMRMKRLDLYYWSMAHCPPIASADGGSDAPDAAALAALRDHIQHPPGR